MEEMTFRGDLLDHEPEPVTKSLVNGKFVSLSTRPKSEVSAVLRQLRAGRNMGYAQLKQMSPEHVAFKEARAGGEYKNLHAAMRNQSPEGRKLQQQLADENNFGAFTTRQGGKNTGQSFVFTNEKAPGMYRDPKMGQRHAAHVGPHEAAHANVRRSEYRMHAQIGGNPYKLGREEARADYMAGGHYKKSNMRANSRGEGPSGYPTMAARDKAVQIGSRLAGLNPPKNSTFSEGYFGMHRELKRKGVKGGDPQFYSKPNAFAYDNRGKIAGGTVLASVGGYGAWKHQQRDSGGRWSKGGAVQKSDSRSWRTIEQSERMARRNRKRQRNSLIASGVGLNVAVGSQVLGNPRAEAETIGRGTKKLAQGLKARQVRPGTAAKLGGGLLKRNPAGTALLGGGALIAGGLGGWGANRAAESINQGRADRRRKAYHARLKKSFPHKEELPTSKGQIALQGINAAVNSKPAKRLVALKKASPTGPDLATKGGMLKPVSVRRKKRAAS